MNQPPCWTAPHYTGFLRIASPLARAGRQAEVAADRVEVALVPVHRVRRVRLFEHLRQNAHVAQQVLRKILPTKITVTPMPDGGWQFSGLCDYRKVLAELGLDAVTAVLEEAATKSSGTPARRAGRST